MSRQELVNHWISDLENGTFLTSKHNPSGIPNPDNDFRTVTVKQADGLQQFLEAGEYRIRKYHNHNYPNTPDYYEIVPDDSSVVTGSGIPGRSTTPTTSCDVFVVVSGSTAGNHIFAEQSTNLRENVSNRDLTFEVELL